MPKRMNDAERMFPTETLLKSKELADYQPDFARVILTEPAYSLSGAKVVLDKALKGKDDMG